MRKIFNTKNLMRFIFLTFIGSIIYILIRIILSPAVAPSSEIIIRVKGDYSLMLIQCVLGAVAMLIPGFLKRYIGLTIPSVMMIIYAVFLYCAIYLGEVRAFYYDIANWDTVLHIFSSVALGALGFSLVSLLNKEEAVTFTLSPAFVAIFAFCFALSLGALWEIYEFTIDSIAHTNSQKYALETGELLVGQAALRDTMKDIITDAAGALAVSAVGFISMKYKKGWVERFQLKMTKTKKGTAEAVPSDK